MADILDAMPSPRSLPRALVRTAAGCLAVLLLLTVLGARVPLPVSGGGTPGPAAYAHRQRAQAEAPLAVSIDSLTPSAVPARPRGQVRVSGTVTNTDAVAWEDVRVYAFVGGTPMTTSDELALASVTSEEEYVGDRITVEGTFATIASLEPGATVSYELRVPRDLLPEAEGVYWFGVHALGNNDVAGEARADGRARTFLPLLARQRASDPVPTSFVIPLRRRVLRAPDGRLAQTSGWTTALSPGGRLHALLDVGLASGTRSVSWLVDPAVLDAVHQLAAGNPARHTAATEGPDGETDDETADTPSDAASADQSASPSTGPAPSSSPTAPTEEERAAAAATAAATAWLERFERARVGAEVLALPYGDPDLSAVADHGPGLYAAAHERSAALMTRWGITATPVDAPPAGYADADGLSLGDPAVPVILHDRAFAPSEEGTVPPVLSTNGRRVLTTATRAISGGPPPGPRFGTVPLRQRLLAEAAVRALAADGPTLAEPLLVTMPATWDPDSPMGFFEGLDLPWMDLETVSQSYGSRTATATQEETVYPEAETARELDGDQLRTVLALVEAGQTLQRVLARNDTVGLEVLQEALTGASYAARGGGGRAIERSLEEIEAQLASITVDARRVTLSSATGSFPVTVTNGMDQPVRIVLEPSTDAGLEIVGPESIEVPAEGRVTLLLEARAERTGLHNVDLLVTDTEGTRLGGRADLPLRAAEVSNIIWVFLGTGAALLFGAIGVRLVRRVRGKEGTA